jgi:hypothetical protein
MKQRLSSEANSYSATQKIPHLLWNLKVHSCVHNSLLLVPIQSQKHMKSYSLLNLHSLKIKSAWSELWKAIQISLVQRCHRFQLARADKFSFKIIDFCQSMIRAKNTYHEDVSEAVSSHGYHTVIASN